MSNFISLFYWSHYGPQPKCTLIVKQPLKAYIAKLLFHQSLIAKLRCDYMVTGQWQCSYRHAIGIIQGGIICLGSLVSVGLCLWSVQNTKSDEIFLLWVEHNTRRYMSCCHITYWPVIGSICPWQPFPILGGFVLLCAWLIPSGLRTSPAQAYYF